MLRSSSLLNPLKRDYQQQQLIPVVYCCTKSFLHIPKFPNLIKNRRYSTFIDSNKSIKLRKMSYFVIGVSGITCGGKTTLTKLIQRSFPWSRIIHQDHYFYDDDWDKHIRLPDVDNHVNYEIFDAMNMDQMYKDIQSVLKGPGEFFDGRLNGIKVLNGDFPANSHPEDAPNFDSGLELLKTVQEIDFDTFKYKNVPVLILEGFTMFESKYIYDQCDVRFFVDLDKEECKKRRKTRNYNPPDCSEYFEKCVWPEYLKHFETVISNQTGIKVFDGKTPIQKLWRESVQIVGCRLEEKYFLKEVDNQKTVQTNK